MTIDTAQSFCDMPAGFPLQLSEAAFLRAGHIMAFGLRACASLSVICEQP
jgi:hypothetical protein